jgi:hypothetical protein
MLTFVGGAMTRGGPLPAAAADDDDGDAEDDGDGDELGSRLAELTRLRSTLRRPP